MQRFLPGSVKRGVKTIWSRFIEWLREWTKPDNHGLAGGAVADATRSKSHLILENALLRQQVIVLERQVKRPQLSWRERGIMVLLASKLRNWKGALIIEQPDTLLRWHRDIFRLVWRRKSHVRQPGDRCPLPGHVVHLIRRLARENPLWGAERIRGEMLKLNVGVANSSVQKYMQDLRRVGPSGQNWGTFLRNRASGMRSGGKPGRVLRLGNRQERRSRKTSPVSHQRLAQEIEHRTLLLATGFDHAQNTFDKAAARIGVRAMRGASPDDRMAQCTLGTVVGGFHAR